MPSSLVGSHASVVCGLYFCQATKEKASVTNCIWREQWSRNTLGIPRLTANLSSPEVEWTSHLLSAFAQEQQAYQHLCLLISLYWQKLVLHFIASQYWPLKCTLHCILFPEAPLTKVETAEQIDCSKQSFKSPCNRNPRSSVVVQILTSQGSTHTKRRKTRQGLSGAYSCEKTSQCRKPVDPGGVERGEWKWWGEMTLSLGLKGRIGHEFNKMATNSQGHYVTRGEQDGHQGPSMNHGGGQVF